jgi:CheY-like chemotaxis protein
MPDVILLDIEMPRMDGFEFTKTIKANPAHASIPIVMITSRTAEKHRNLAKTWVSTSISASRSRKKSCCGTCARCWR